MEPSAIGSSGRFHFFGYNITSKKDGMKYLVIICLIW